jgi:beta-galactosidase/beta-glucuronidase
VLVEVLDDGAVVASGNGSSGEVLTIELNAPRLWTPDTPYLYNMTVTLVGVESVGSYFGVRTFTLGKDANNVTRPLLNGEFLFMSGWLDQG